jgi:uncharacterized membrane protein
MTDLVVGLILFASTAVVVVWQNSRLGIIWDLSYILENSYRISLGDIPYRDFPFPYAPLTFLTQAALIKMTGRVFWHHIVYCAVVGGLGTILTWRILLHQLRGFVSSPRVVAFVLSAPLIVLGIYCVYPHPFYDPDCSFVILVCILLLLRLERKGFPALPTSLTGVLLVVPLFVKQNTGLAFLGGLGLALGLLCTINLWQRRNNAPDAGGSVEVQYSVGGYLWLIAGAVGGLIGALLLIHFIAGLGNYQRWTIAFAASRRAPSVGEMVAVYKDRLLFWWLPAFVTGTLILAFNRKEKGMLARLAVAFMAIPFAWPVIYLFRDNDSSERAERFLALWPFLLVIAFFVAVFALLSTRRGLGVKLVLPFILIAVIHGAFLSQQVWGSTYAVWPLFLLLVAGTISAAVTILRERTERLALPMSIVIAVSLFIGGTFYVRSHERLDYANLSDGDLTHSTLPPLKGLSVRGSWLPDFEELVRYADKEIPKEDSILMIPGEDLFYYTTGRRPSFPVLMFDHTVNPYSTEEIIAQARARNIRWLVLKEETQLEEEPLENKDQLLKLLRQDFKHVESLNNYEIYRRRTAGESQDDEDDEDDQDDDKSDSPPSASPSPIKP